ncbi:Two-component response regulator SSK1p [Marasmius crinis-equi]|uniref:Two-component response regulator SSK1p n=1 Tax=Marasmius crinis-equi TaxID=585013 RepID=A0ABR3FL54_9AGAR
MSFSSLHEVRSRSPVGPSTLVRKGSGRSKPNSPRIAPTSPHQPVEGTSLNLNLGAVTPSDEQMVQSPKQMNRRGSADLPGPQRKLSGGPGSPRPTSPTNEPPSRKSSTPGRRDSNTLAPASTTTKAKSPADSNIVPPISVLIVDDNPINRRILKTFMKQKKIKFDEASNGKEAVEKWRTGEFHLILMDIQMPIMDGISATKEIRRIEKLNACAGFPPNTPGSEAEPPTPSDTSAGTRSTASPYRSSVIIVALTASSLQSDRIAALAAGCNDFLTKPVMLKWLNNKLIEWGSIKALQMWADLAPSVGMPEARTVAENLHVPMDRSARATPPSNAVSPPQGQNVNAPVSPVRPAPARRQLSASSLTATTLVAEPTSILANGGELQLGGITEKDRLARRQSSGAGDPLSPSSPISSAENRKTSTVPLTGELLLFSNFLCDETHYIDPGSASAPTEEQLQPQDEKDEAQKAEPPQSDSVSNHDGNSAEAGDGYDGR